jgi:flagellar biosynthesis protein FlhF
MKIKKFKARNFADALDLVKKELSEDAIILSSEEKRGIRPFVEVTAAVDYDSGYNPPTPPLEKGGKEGFEKGGHGGIANSEFRTPNSELLSSTLVDEIKNEIGSLKGIIENMKNTGYNLSLPPEKRMILHFLMRRSIREEFALRLCEKAKDLSQIPSLISNDIKVKPMSTDKKAVMLIGPTGVGKTTTIAKLSALAIQEGKKAAMVNLDTYRIGAVEQVRIYSRIMGIPLSIVSQGKELEECLLRYSESRDIIFIDTTGRNPRDESYINEIMSICQIKVPVELHLLMSASSDDEFMIDAYRFYRMLPVDYIAFTKVDEAVRYGTLYNLLLTYQKPVAFVTTGQKVPGDIEFITPDKLTNLILRKRSYTC